MELAAYFITMIIILKVYYWFENNPRIDRNLAKKMEMADFKNHLDQLKNTVMDSYNLKPCPKCFEGKIAILKVSETGQSVDYCCANCNKKITGKLLPNKNGGIAAEQFNMINRKFGVVILGHQIYFQSGFVDASFRINIKTDISKDDRKRNSIPESVRNEVWRRDQGKCVNCESQINLEFDHIIPFSKGGSDTARNIQLLCEKCNREKSNKI